MSFIKRLLRGKIDEIKNWQDPDREENPMPCPEITIDGIDADLHSKLLGEATAAGAQFEGATVAFDNCIFDWNYDAPSATLHVTCIKKPFYIGCGLIAEKIQELAVKAKGGL